MWKTGLVPFSAGRHEYGVPVIFPAILAGATDFPQRCAVGSRRQACLGGLPVLRFAGGASLMHAVAALCAGGVKPGAAGAFFAWASLARCHRRRLSCRR